MNRSAYSAFLFEMVIVSAHMAPFGIILFLKFGIFLWRSVENWNVDNLCGLAYEYLAIVHEIQFMKNMVSIPLNWVAFRHFPKYSTFSPLKCTTFLHASIWYCFITHNKRAQSIQIGISRVPFIWLIPAKCFNHAQSLANTRRFLFVLHFNFAPFLALILSLAPILFFVCIIACSLSNSI